MFVATRSLNNLTLGYFVLSFVVNVFTHPVFDTTHTFISTVSPTELCVCMYVADCNFVFLISNK